MNKTNKLTLIGLLTALTILLGLTPLGYIPFGVIRVTTLHIPTIIGAIVSGPLVGGLVGLSFGLFSLFQNLTAPTSILFFMFLNPLVSVLPRVLIGVGTGYLYIFFKKINFTSRVVPFIVGGSGAIINTVGVLGMAYIFFASRISEVFKGENAGKILFGIASMNLPFEILATTIIVGLVSIPLLKSQSNKK